MNKIIDDYTNNEPLYVHNTTKTDFNFVVNIDGRLVPIPVPRSFIPFDLRIWASTEILKKSADLRSAIRTGILELVEKDAAEEILKSREGQREYERLRKLFNLVPDSLKSDDITNSADLDIAAVSDMDEVNGQIMETMINPNTSPDDKFALIAALDKESSLRLVDLEYIKSTANEHCTELLAWVDKKLEELNKENVGLRKYAK